MTLNFFTPITQLLRSITKIYCIPELIRPSVLNINTKKQSYQNKQICQRKMKIFLILLIVSHLSLALVYEVQIGRRKFSVNLDVEEDNFKSVSAGCKEALNGIYVKAMENVTGNKCKTSMTIFGYTEEIKKACGSTRYDREFGNTYIKVIFDEMRECLHLKIPDCSINEFYLKCWMGQLENLHYIPPFVTDITATDVHLFERKFRDFSSINRRNTCCLMKRAGICFEKMLHGVCGDLAEQSFGLREAAENYRNFMRMKVNRTYYTEIDKILHCESFFHREEVCVFVSCGSSIALSFYIFVFYIFQIII